MDATDPGRVDPALRRRVADALERVADENAADPDLAAQRARRAERRRAEAARAVRGPAGP